SQALGDWLAGRKTPHAFIIQCPMRSNARCVAMTSGGGPIRHGRRSCGSSEWIPRMRRLALAAALLALPPLAAQAGTMKSPTLSSTQCGVSTDYDVLVD